MGVAVSHSGYSTCRWGPWDEEPCSTHTCEDRLGKVDSLKPSSYQPCSRSQTEQWKGLGMRLGSDAQLTYTGCGFSLVESLTAV